MKPLTDMQFRLRDLPETREFSLTEAFLRDALAAIPGQATLDDPNLGTVAVTVEVVEEQGTVLARGSLQGSAKVACSRCLGPVALPIDDHFTLTFLPHDDHVDGEDVELEDDDIDVATHDGELVDIAPVLRDHVVLSVPYAPLCAETCKGLCANCGAELNEGPCECPPPADDSPWSALKNLKLERSS